MIRDSPIGVLMSYANDEQLFYLRQMVMEAENETKFLINLRSSNGDDAESGLMATRGRMRSYIEKLASLGIEKIDKYNLISRMSGEYGQYSRMEIPKYSKDKN